MNLVVSEAFSARSWEKDQDENASPGRISETLTIMKFEQIEAGQFSNQK